MFITKTLKSDKAHRAQDLEGIQVSEAVPSPLPHASHAHAHHRALPSPPPATLLKPPATLPNPLPL